MNLNKKVENKMEINLLIFSDLHFGFDRNKTEAIYRKNILDQIINYFETIEDNWKPDCIAIIGDIGWAGKKKDYFLAKEWIEVLLEALNLSSNKLIICPGNHDINIDIINPKDLKRPDSREEAEKYLNIENFENIKLWFKDFNRFCQKSIPPLKFDETENYLIGTRKIAELPQIKFLIIN